MLQIAKLYSYNEICIKQTDSVQIIFLENVLYLKSVLYNMFLSLTKANWRKLRLISYYRNLLRDTY